jgi:hypothetical protein
VLDEGSGDDSGSLGRGVGSMGLDLAEAGRRCRIRIVAQFFEMGERRNRSTGLAGGSTDETEGMEMRREPLGGLACGTGHGDAADLRAQHQNGSFLRQPNYPHGPCALLSSQPICSMPNNIRARKKFRKRAGTLSNLSFFKVDF